jgi:hypothetical protein
MTDTTLIGVKRGTKDAMEAYKPEGVAWHVFIDFIFYEFLDHVEEYDIEQGDEWLEQLFNE